MSNPPVPPCLDTPWTSFFAPALLGEAESVLEELEFHFKSVEPARRGALMALGARVAFIAGEPSRGLALHAEAMSHGASEAEALSVFVGPDGRRWAEIRCHEALAPGALADAACDLLVVCLAEGAVEEGLRVVFQALRECPDHAELGRWRRCLAQLDVARASELVRLRLRRGPDTEERAPEAASADEILEADLEALVPCAATGWLSPERIARRVIHGAWEQRPPRPSALAVAHDAGLGALRFATPEEYAELPPGHPLLDLEVTADRMESLLEEGRPAVATAFDLWRRSKDMPRPVIEECVALIASAGFENPDIAVIGLKALGWMTRQARRASRRGAWSLDLRTWSACKARLLASVRRLSEARELALDLAARDDLASGARLLVHETLRRVEGLSDTLPARLPLVEPSREAPAELEALLGSPLRVLAPPRARSSLPARSKCA